jgi:hypothetical protein
MKQVAERIVFDADNPLFKRAYPVLLNIFCRGARATSAKQLMLTSGLSILVSPVGWAVAIFRRGIHILIVLGLWWFLRGEISELGISPILILAIALVAVLYKEIYQELVDFALYMLIFVTGGGFLKWMCAGYLSGTGFRQYAMTKDHMSRIVGTMVNGIAHPFRAEYEAIMNLYLDSNVPSNEERLNSLLDSYSQGVR